MLLDVPNCLVKMLAFRAIFAFEQLQCVIPKEARFEEVVAGYLLINIVNFLFNVAIFLLQ